LNRWLEAVFTAGQTNSIAMFFDECELKSTVQGDYDSAFIGQPRIFVSRNPKISAEKI
jgi:hypothetical protein